MATARISLRSLVTALTLALWAMLGETPSEPALPAGWHLGAGRQMADQPAVPKPVDLMAAV